MTARDHIVSFVDAGVCAIDMGDIYTGVEERVGVALHREEGIMHQSGGSGMGDVDRARIHTKLVPDLDVLDRINATYVEVRVTI